MKKDPGTPNLFPFKDKILAGVDENKRARAEEIIKRREAAKASKEGAQDLPIDDGSADNPTLGDRKPVDKKDEDEDDWNH